MSLLPKARIWRFTLAGLASGFATLLFATFRPIWEMYYLNPIEGLGERRSLWFVISEVKRGRQGGRDPDFPVTITADLEDALTVAAIVFVGGFLLGIGIYAVARFFRSARFAQLIEQIKHGSAVRNVFWIQFVLWVALAGAIFGIAMG